MREIIFCITLFLLFPVNSDSQNQECTVKGVVWDQKKEGVPFVNVFFKDGDLEGQVTNEKGEFEIKAKKCGKRELMTTRLGYEKKELKIELTPNESISLKITLDEKPIQIEGLTVTASSFSSKEEKGITIKQMDVFTTPGASADVFQSVKALPGLTQVSESAELFVRGGNPYETITLLDQASLTHPYHLESHYGGLFGTIDPSVIQDIYFSSGGFSAKYGNALSGVLDIQTKDEVEKNELDVSLNLAGCGMSLASPFYGGKLGFRFSGRKSFTDLLFKINKLKTDFISIPTSEDATISLIYKYSPFGKIRFSALNGDDQQSLTVELPSYAHQFNSNSENALYNLQISDLFHKALLSKTSFSYGRYSQGWDFGVWKMENKEGIKKFRSDNQLLYRGDDSFNFGVEINMSDFSFIGVFPQDSTDFSSDAPPKKIEDKREVILGGGYLENETHLSNKLFFTSGIRSDYQNLSKSLNFDYRVSCGFSASSSDVIKLSWGTFHQYPQPMYYDRIYGNPKLEASKAYHTVIGWERKKQTLTLRIEAYHKRYERLPLDHPTLNYSNQGYGYARGVDLIVKGDINPKISGWIAYGFIDTKRKQLDFQKLLATQYDITHNLTLVGKINLGRFYELGLNYRLATGQPFTPIVGAYYDSAQKVWKPTYGPTNSERMPIYNRLDVRLTKIFSIHPNLFSIFYLEFLNILNIANIMDYTYSEDYSQREKVLSFFSQRSFVFGIGMYF